MSEKQETNTSRRSEEAELWTKFSAVTLPTVTANSPRCGVAPDGTLTADLVTLNDATPVTNDGIYSPYAASATSGAGGYGTSGYKASLWAWTLDAGVCNLGLGDTTAGMIQALDISASKTRQPLALMTPIAGSLAQAWVGYAGAGHDGGTRCTEWCQWGVQVEGLAGAPTSSSYIRTEGASATRVTSVVSVPNPLSGAVGGDWCMAATVTWPAATTSLADLQVIDVGGYAVNNSAKLSLNGPTGWPRFDIKDSAGTMVSEYTVSVLPVGPTRLRACMQGGNPYIWIDGVRQAKNAGASNNITQPATVYLSGDVSGVLPNGGVAKDFCVGAGDSCQ